MDRTVPVLIAFRDGGQNSGGKRISFNDSAGKVDPPLRVFPAPTRLANRAVPRNTVLGGPDYRTPPPPPLPEPEPDNTDAPINAIHVCRRLRAPHSPIKKPPILSRKRETGVAHAEAQAIYVFHTAAPTGGARIMSNGGIFMTSQSPVLKLARVAAVSALALGLAVAPLSLNSGASGTAHAQEGPVSVADLSERLIDSVVNISTSQTVGGSERNVPRPNLPEGSPFQEFFDEFFENLPNGEGRPGPRSRQVQSLGSGFVIDADGLIITNNHVIADADEVSVNFNDGTKLSAEVIGRDSKTDIAVLRVDPDGMELKAVSFGDSNSARVGDWVLAIGNPFGLGGTVTLGIVSAIGRDINSGPYDNFIQTDAAINRGNSGGPLFNMQGDVIGINTAIISPSGGSIGIGFSIPAELASNVIDQLIEFGETRRGWLGVRIQEVTDEIAESLGMDEAMGALVAGVIKGGPVDDGSIQPGDVIIEFDGKPVESMRELPRIVADSPVGKEVDVIVMRKGERETVQVTLGRLEDGEELAAAEQLETSKDDEEEAVEVFGMMLAELDDEQRESFSIEESVDEGVIITAVEPESAAAEKGIQPGEIIVEVAQEAVTTPQEVVEAIERLQEENRRNALLMLSSKTGELRFVTIRVD